jgi:hypothetical protein
MYWSVQYIRVVHTVPTQISLCLVVGLSSHIHCTYLDSYNTGTLVRDIVVDVNKRASAQRIVCCNRI